MTGQIVECPSCCEMIECESDTIEITCSKCFEMFIVYKSQSKEQEL